VTPAVYLSIAFIHLLGAISPGPSFVVILRVAAAEGLRNALLVAVGFGLGAMFWAGAAMLGLAVLFQIAPMLLTALKLAGAGFLLFIAFMLWRHAEDPLPHADISEHRPSAQAALRLGLLTQLSNPKVVVFFGAVFVGVIPPEIQLHETAIVLGLVFLVEMLWYVVVARLFSLAAARTAYTRLKKWTDRLFGGAIALFSLKIATT